MAIDTCASVGVGLIVARHNFFIDAVLSAIKRKMQRYTADVTQRNEILPRTLISDINIKYLFQRPEKHFL